MEIFFRLLPSAEHISIAFFTWLTTVATHGELRRSMIERIRKLERHAFGRAEDDAPAAVK